MEHIIMSSLLIMGSGALGLYLDITGKVTDPSVFWLIGTLTGIMATLVMFRPEIFLK